MQQPAKRWQASGGTRGERAARLHNVADAEMGMFQSQPVQKRETKVFDFPWFKGYNQLAVGNYETDATDCHTGDKKKSFRVFLPPEVNKPKDRIVGPSTAS